MQTTLDDVLARISAMPDDDAGFHAEAAADYGRFVGLPAKIALDENGRSANLLESIGYVAASGEDWPVPAGAWLDGASIPKAFWSVIGGPFEGKYREPSIVHDHYCIVKTRPWRDTHRMFHAAMLCRGVSGFKARTMFYAVYRFGPRWGVPGDIAEAAPAAEVADDANADSILRDIEAIRNGALSLHDIEQLADRSADSPAG
ncbi:DUF1353 domain-containing protein [Lysobacter enzymogenes]|uniref:DUF1353 domain-containing protein n=1 Tax=Lysobacter enzymogenes TaxID=69 RepID=A0A3N2RL48_LYSEN|nr:DUF1353 domain-containing protein [Lysobacter enzymogenes]ROU08129.1 DUF1353 domain-containing protein [Lysobacter enzymogenes]